MSELSEVRWSEVKWAKVHPRRCHGSRVKLPVAEKCWKQVQRRLHKHRSAFSPELEEFVAKLDGEKMPETLSSSEWQLQMANEVLHREWQGPRPPKGFVGYWFARGGPEFCVRTLLNSETLVESGLLELRRFLSAVDEQSYQDTVAAVGPMRHSKEGQASPFVFAYLFPDQAEWVEEALEIFRADTSLNKEGWMVLSSLPTLEPVSELAARTNYFWYDWVSPYLTSLAVQHGAAAVPALMSILGLTRSAHERKSCAKALALIESPEVAKFMAGQLGDKGIRDVASLYLKQCPEVAIPALKAQDGKAARSLLKSLTTVVPVVEVAASESLPEVLLNPPWKRRKKSKLEPPVVLELPTLVYEESIAWEPDERERVLAEYERRTKQSAPRFRERAQETLEERGVLYRWMSWHLPKEQYRSLWLQMDLEVWAPKDYDSDTTDGLLTETMALFGEEAISSGLTFAEHGPKYALPQLARLDSPRVAPLMVPQLGKRTTLRHVAIDWLREHPQAAATGLIPLAFGPTGKSREQAQLGLNLLRALGETDILREVAQRYGASAAVQEWLSRDRLLDCPSKAPKLSKFVNVETLSPPRLKEGGALSPAAVGHLCTMLMFSPVSPTYAGLTVVREACCPDSLSDFAWELVTAWLESGGSTASNWALFGLVHLGQASTARELATAIRGWQRNKQKARALVGLEVLGEMGSDVALMHLANFSVKAASSKLREAAAAQLRRVAKFRRLTLEELADRTAPDLGLDDDGSLKLDLGGRELFVEFDQNLKPRLRDADGPVARFPRAAKADDKTKVKAASTRWKELVKDADSVASGQVARLESAMCKNRRWSASDFRGFLLEHPLVGHLTRRLVWATYNEKGQVQSTFRVCEDRSLADLEDNAWTLPETAVVGVPHPVDCAELAAWGDLFSDYELLQPFPQLGREVFHPEQPDASSLSTVKGVEVPARVLLGLNRRGWVLEHDSYNFSHYSKELEGGLAVLDFDPGLEGDNFAGSGPQSLGDVRLRGLTAGQTAPVEYSELVRDLESLRL